MPVHFLHIGKTGGSAIKRAIRSAGEPETKYGRILYHPHSFSLDEVPEGHEVFFTVRDPISRFVSGFYSRLRKGRPKYLKEWSDQEREAFAVFETPQALAAGLVSKDHELRAKATVAMSEIHHLRSALGKWLGSPALLKRRSPSIIYIARQETLGEDWEQLRDLLALPPDVMLPKDPKDAHRGLASEDRRLDETAIRALRNWYAKDYRLLALCEKYRRERGWGSPVEGHPSGHGLVTARAEWAILRVKQRVSRALRA